MENLHDHADQHDISSPCEDIIRALERRPNFSDDTGEAAEILRHEVQTLRRFGNLISRVRRAQPPREQIERDYWEKTGLVVRRCLTTLSVLDSLLQGEDAKPSESYLRLEIEGIGQSPLGPSEQRLRAQITLYTKTFQMTLQAINLVHQRRGKYPLSNVQASQQSLSISIQELKSILGERRNDGYNSFQIDGVDDNALLCDVESCVVSAESIMNNTSAATSKGRELSWPLNSHGAATQPAQKVSSVFQGESNARCLEIRSPAKQPVTDPFSDTNAKHRGSTDSERDSDPEPGFHYGFPPMVYSELINALVDESQREVQAGNYEKAEIAQCRAIEYLEGQEANLNISLDAKTQMLETLGNIYVRTKKFDKAKAILSPLLRQETTETERKWRLYYTLAGVYLAQDRLPDAEKFAKRAYIGREKALGKGHALIQQSADLLALIYEKQGEKQAAQAFRSLYPTEKMLAELPKISKHVGTTRVAWNPDLSVNMNALNKSGKTTLINAISSGDEDSVQRILRCGADVEVRCDGGITPLMYAVIHGQVKIAGVLLSRGAQVDAITSGWTALHKAADLGDWKMVQLLIDNNAGAEARGPKYFSPNNGRGAGRESTATEYADEDSDPDDEHGWTALLRAADSGKEPMVRLLLDNGANIEARNPSSGTPLSCAAENQHSDTVALLLLHGANADAEDEFGWRPLHRAQVHRGGDEVARQLLNSGANVNASCVKGKTPLHYATERENESMVHLLLAAGADIGATDVAKRTPLHTAIECRLENMVHLLLEAGADASIKDGAGHDALAAASHALRRSPEIVKLLSKHVKALKREEDAVEKTRRSSTLSSGSGGSPATASGRPGSWWSRRSKK